MSDEGDVGIVYGLQETASHLRAILIEVGVDAGDDDVHLGKHGVGEIERAVGEDIHFDAGEDADAIELLSGGADALDVLGGARVVESIGEREVLGVVGDGHVFVA